MMIGMSVSWIAAFIVPVRNLLPRLAGIFRAMQVNASANYVIRIVRMNDDRIAVRDLSFALKMGAMNVFPTVAAVGAAENAEQKILVTAGFVLGERVKHIRFRRTDCQSRATEKRGTGKSVRQVFPFLSCVLRAPDAALHALLSERCEDCSPGCWVEDNRVTPVVLS